MKTTIQLKKQFFDSLKRGTGEAFLIMRENPSIDFSDLIIQGATTNFAFDKQGDSSRASYMYQFINCSKQKDIIIQEVLQKLQTEAQDFWSLNQMCDLAVILYRSGYPEAKTAIYNRFEKNSNMNYVYCGESQLVELDGMDGILKIANCVGKMLFEGKLADYESSWRFAFYQKDNPTIDINKELKKASEKNHYIKAFYDSIQKNNWTIKNQETSKRLSYEFIKEKFDTSQIHFLFSERNNELSLAEIKQLATDFLAEKDIQEKEKYLQLFSFRKFPFDYNPILQIAQDTNPDHSRLVELAIRSLKYFSSKEIRTLALAKLSKKNNPSFYLDLLVSNYQKGDYKLLSELATSAEDDETIEYIADGLIKIYEANSTKECKEPLEILYTKINCGILRYSIVKILHDNKVMSGKILEEIEFDCNEDLRQLYSQTKTACHNQAFNRDQFGTSSRAM
ncbi:hypothetical protein MASR2M44_24100 [Bacteroidota bacterium]